MYFIILSLLIFKTQLIKTENAMMPANDLDLVFDHIWNVRDDMLKIYFNISNSTFKSYRYYFYDLRRFALPDSIKYFPRQRLIDTQNSLNIFGVHEDDYVSCVSFVDEYENIFRPRYGCYEFTIGEKTIGSHHGSKSGHLSPLLLAVAFVLHVFIAIVHHIKAKHYARNLLQRFIDVNPKASRKVFNIKSSLKKLDHPRVSVSVQRRLSRVSVDVGVDERHSIATQSSTDDTPIYVLPHHNRKVSLGLMKTIPESIA
ncbi:unnamed protein product [Rotaria socialis]|nr:unnamed protein product [Rotaria socialis]CAF4524112.1 unnamed protein product [Rotaria socialis]